MNICKKTMLLMALCCSIGAPTSAVEAEPKDEVAPTKHIKSAQDFKKEIQKTVKEMLTLLNTNLMSYVNIKPVNLSESKIIDNITQLEKRASELNTHKDEIGKEIENIRNSGFLSEKEKRSQMDILNAIFKCKEVFDGVMKKILTDIYYSQMGCSDEPDTSETTNGFLDITKTGISLSKFLNRLKQIEDCNNDEPDKELKGNTQREDRYNKKLDYNRGKLIKTVYTFIGRRKAIENELTKLDTKLDREIYRDTDVGIIESCNVKRQRRN